MTGVSNPVLPGFHPDPDIIRVGEFYYIATSTFEWWPGVRIHRSRDLARWDPVGYALMRKSQLDMRGDPDSGGVWAPGLSYADGLFWLVYSDVKSHRSPFKDVCNYLVTAERIEGPWSEPVRLNRSGFDPSLFHDVDGRKWLVNQLWKPGTDGEAFAGIVLQEYSVAERRLVGPIRNIYRGTSLGLTEGPHLYRKDGYYYLLTAEGGTSWGHAVTIARSKVLAGPYETSPHHPLLTSAGDPEIVLQKAGHGSLVCAADGSWYLAHLCSRPVGASRRCILGRETAIQRISWPEGDWPVLASRGNEPEEFFTLPSGPAAVPASSEFHDHFDVPELGVHWNTLREPADPTWLSLTERRGFLRLRGRYSLQSLFDQSLVGLRVQHHHCEILTALEFAPASFQQSAGLALYYNTSNHYCLVVTADEAGSRLIRVRGCDNGHAIDLASEPAPNTADGTLVLKAVLRDEWLQFYIGTTPTDTRPFGPRLDATILSDDYPDENGHGLTFTGTFAALWAQDSSELGVPADFDWFSYRELPSKPASGSSQEP